MQEAFQIVVLGCTGGPKESNLSGYLLSPLQTSEWIALDAGSLLVGIERAIEKGNLAHVAFTDKQLQPAIEMLSKHIRGFLISHAHLDHILGLVMNSQADSYKFIAGIDTTIDNIRDHIFNARIWPNYGNEGVDPILAHYKYLRLPLKERQKIPNTSMQVEAFLLSHPGGYPSTAFLIEHSDQYLLYFGDTSSDFLEEEKHLARIWHRITPLLKEKRFHGMLLECSFSHKESEQVIYGHLDTKLVMKELHHLQEISGVPLKGLKVMLTHKKESLHNRFDVCTQIKEELREMNDLGIDFIFPEQGDRFTF